MAETDLRATAKKIVYRFEAGTASTREALTGAIAAALAAVQQETITGDTSDGYHTFKELYAYRKAYNAVLFNEWAAQARYDVHKSRHHADGEACFGGGWFVVMASTPAGQISNHYKDADWELFRVPERERAIQWDGHTPQQALDRLLELAQSAPKAPRPEATRAASSQ